MKSTKNENKQMQWILCKKTVKKFFPRYISINDLTWVVLHITSIRQVQEYTYYASLYRVWYHLPWRYFTIHCINQTTFFLMLFYVCLIHVYRYSHWLYHTGNKRCQLIKVYSQSNSRQTWNHNMTMFATKVFLSKCSCYERSLIELFH